MLPLTTLYNEYIDRSKFTKQKSKPADRRQIIAVDSHNQDWD